MRKSSATRESSSSSSSSVTSSTNSSSNYQTLDSPGLLGRSISSSSSIAMRNSSNLHTDLSLGLSISTSNFCPRQEASDDWPASSSSSSSKQVMRMNNNSLFVKVNMEGSKIGRKIDVLALHGYPHLITTLEHMFNTPNILWAEGEQDCHHKRYSCSHVLTYEDQDGDWMMVGDVPWEMFLTTVKRLKITSTSHS